MTRRILLIILVLIMSSFALGLCQNADSAKGRKVNPTGALMRSAFIPGWGQLYNRKYIKATVFAGGEGWLIHGIYKDWKAADKHERNFRGADSDPIYQAVEFAKFENSRDARNLKMWILAASIFYSMFDAYVDAQLSNFNQTDRSFDVYLGPGDNDDIRLAIVLDLP